MKGRVWPCRGPVQGSARLYQEPEQLGVSLGNAIFQRCAIVAVDVGSRLDKSFSQWDLLLYRPRLCWDGVAHGGGREWEPLSALEQFLEQLQVACSQRAHDGPA